jgi:signal transduction histidine kinase
LYIHIISQFSGYQYPNIPTEWFERNISSIEKLNVEFELKSWAAGLKNAGYNDWYTRIKRDFFADSSFKNAVIQLAMEFTNKNFFDIDIGASIDFLLEETAYTALNLNGANIVYPTGVSLPVNVAIRKYSLTTRYFSYKLSNHAQKHTIRIINREEVNKEVINFITKTTTNINFFVVDREGNIVYKNESLSAIVSEKNAKEVEPKTWQNSLKVMEKRQMFVFEESDKNKTFLSVKAPLVIRGIIEGIIGLSVDITERKKRQELEKQLEMERELYTLAREVAHDIKSPILSLKAIEDSLKRRLSENDSHILNSVIVNIENMARKLTERHKCSKDLKSNAIDKYVSVYSCLEDVIKTKKIYCEKNEKSSIVFNFKYDQESRMIVVRGDYTDFNRMISNLLNNSVESLRGIGDLAGVIDVSLKVKNDKVEVIVKDNGESMSKEILEKINNNNFTSISKMYGHGMGMQQVKRVIENMDGTLNIKSRKGMGTEIVISFPRIQNLPRWLVGKIELNKGDTLVILDDSDSTRKIWQKRLAKYKNDLDVKYFLDPVKTVDFLNTLKDKSKVFLITDYTFENQLMNGIDVIEKCGMQNRSVLSSWTHNPRIKDFNKKAEMYLKFLYKLFLEDVILSVK